MRFEEIDSIVTRSDANLVPRKSPKEAKAERRRNEGERQLANVLGLPGAKIIQCAGGKGNFTPKEQR